MTAATTTSHPRLGGHVETCRLEPVDDGRIGLELCGSLPRGWSVRLSRGLAQQGASLRSGSALRGDAEHWQARFELDPGPLGLRGDDCEAWVVGRARPAPSPMPLPQVLDYTLDTDPGGVLLEVHAWDGVGLLAAVLERIWANGLRLQTLALETEAECAFQSMLLTDDALRAPSDAQCDALAKALSALTV